MNYASISRKLPKARYPISHIFNTDSSHMIKDHHRHSLLIFVRGNLESQTQIRMNSSKYSQVRFNCLDSLTGEAIETSVAPTKNLPKNGESSISEIIEVDVRLYFFFFNLCFVLFFPL